MKYKHLFPLALLVIAIGFWITVQTNDSQIKASHGTVSKSARGGIRGMECAQGGMHKGCTHDPFFSLDPVTLAHNEAVTRKRLFTEIPAKAKGTNLIESVQQDSDWKGQTGGAIRARQVRLSEKFLDKNPFQKGEILKLNLFDDVGLDTVVHESFSNVNQTVSTTTRVANTMFGRAVMAFTENELRVKVILPESNKIYEVQYNHADGNHYVLEMDPSIVEADGCGVVEGSPFRNPPKAAGGEVAQSELPAPPMVAGDEGQALVVIDNLVVYPENVVTSAGSEANVKNIAAQGIALANDAHNTTNTGMYINLIHSARLTGYTDSGVQGTDLNRVTNLADGYIDSVHTLRNTYGADFVHMMHSVGGGLGWMPNFATTDPGEPDLSFSVTGWESFASYTPAHELGHNMNLDHSKFQEQNTGNPQNPTGTDAAGWHWHPSGNTAVDGHCSVMSYTVYTGEAGHAKVGVFSDPNIVHNGQPVGHVTHANAARVLRAYKNIYATYRTRPLAANSILVESPNGGEVLSRGQTAQIRWNTNGVSGYVKIDLYRNGVFEREITAGTINDRIYYYTIPTDLTSSNLYNIRISSVNNPAIADFSDVGFTIAQPIYATNLDTNPGFTISGGGWQYGAPSGNNATYGGAASAFTGTNIYDTNLTGSSFSTHYLTTPAINCSNFQGVRLKFAGQFSVTSAYRAIVQVSNDGTSWTQVSSVTDTYADGWTEYSHDISQVADGQSTVYVRWVHSRDVDGSNYSGMSVDDVSITGIISVTNPVISASVNSLAASTLAGSNPANQAFTVRNSGIGTLSYTISDNQSWLSVSPASGSSTGEDDTITVSYSAAALALGNYSANITITDNAAGNSPVVIPVSLSVNPPPIHFDNMDTNPGWTLQGAWAWGAPTGAGGDPGAGFTGSNVVGYNLNGAYANGMVETHATTPAINCYNYSNVQLSFYRWLGVERGDYDKVYVRVSADGVNWTDVFAHTNNTHAALQDTSWAKYTYDISAIADGQSTVFIRWTMGTTDSSEVYSGWNLDDVKVEGDYTPVSTYTVTFDANGGGVPSPASKLVAYASTYGTLATVSRTGYTFNGWFTAASGGTQVQAGTTVAISANHTLYARWTAATYTVSYNGNGNTGGTAPSNQIKSYGVNLALANQGTLVRSGYTFTGWNTAANGTGTAYVAGATYAANAAVTLYARWTANSYTVTFDANGGTTPIPATTSVTYASTYGALATVSRTGHTFNGWFTAASGGTQVQAGTTVAIIANQTLYARWTAATYTVSYNGNGNTGGTAPTNQTKSYGVNLTLANQGTLVRSGYTFTGWNTAANGTGTAYAAGATYAANAAVTLYARWTVNSYTVTFHPNGGNAPIPATKSVTYGSTYGTLATISRTGYTFTGWFTAAPGGSLVTASTTVTTAGNHTLYARWANTYTVSYNGNGNTGGTAPSNQTKSYGVNLTLANQGTLVRSGYTFAGWNTAANGSGTAYAAGATYTANAALTLYARWIAKSYTVTFNANGGNAPIPATKSVTYRSTYGALATTSRTGYVFTGWFTSASGGSLVTSSTTVTTAGNHTLFARWTGATSLASALDSTGLTWSSSVNAPWVYQTSVSKNGGDAARSGTISDNGSSGLSTTIVGPGTLSFWWKVSSEAGYDFLKFYYDGVLQTEYLAAISGEVGWVQRIVSIPAGTHTVEWRYTKDSSFMGGADRAWVDQVVYTKTASYAETSGTNGGEAPRPAPEPAPVSVATDTYYTVDKDGLKYLTIVIQKADTELTPLVVEVSGNLTEWFSGSNHTTVISDEAGVLKVRDNTPVTAGVNRYIRLKP